MSSKAQVEFMQDVVRLFGRESRTRRIANMPILGTGPPMPTSGAVLSRRTTFVYWPHDNDSTQLMGNHEPTVLHNPLVKLAET